MASRYRNPSGPRFPNDAAPGVSGSVPESRYRYLEFKHLYFRLQSLLNQKVVLSLKYEQLKTPEIRMSLIRPLVSQITQLSSLARLHALFQPSLHDIHETPQFAPLPYGTVASNVSESSISTNVIYVLLLLRYEYQIQSENHLVMYDLLTTKANICEVLAIRMLREYRSMDRINLLFLNPMQLSSDSAPLASEQHHLLKNTKHLVCFNTLELSILAKAKKFLSQPVVIHILDRIYNGDLIIKEQQYPKSDDDSWASLLISSAKPSEDSREYPLLGRSFSAEFNEAEKNVVNYRFNRTSMKKVLVRSQVVPKYQALVINLKYGMLTLLFLVLVLRHKNNSSELGNSFVGKLISVLFWMLALSFNFDNIVKLSHIEFKFLKKIVWTYFDLLIVFLIDTSFVLRLLLIFDKISVSTYYSVFSLISILLFPRMLSVFNNYEFFNMMIVSFKKMSWNMIAMFCLFVSLIFGFFLCFITITIDLSTYEVAFSMLKLFFGFTPAVWDHWDSYNQLGRAIQLAYLFLIQFIVATILAIVLGNVFAKVSQTNKEEFEYLKTTNLIIYLKWGHLHWTQASHMWLIRVFHYVVNFFKFPIILLIYFYELLIKDNRQLLRKQQSDLKTFTFLTREDDFYGDSDMMAIHDEDSDVSTIMLRRNSGAGLGAGGGGALNSTAKKANRLAPQQSINTFAGFRSGSVESAFYDDYIGHKLRAEKEQKPKSHQPRRHSKSTNNDIMAKLRELESLVRAGDDKGRATRVRSAASEFASDRIASASEESNAESSEEQ
ncbi:hypothetical protein E0198_004438 [Clavispora lusitaniae]|nr:hypothetical protein E0198_004438 [Clavispora lusitaniae]